MPLPRSASFCIVESLRLPSIPEHREENALVALLLNQAYQLALACHADVEVSVGGKDHAVDAALDECLARDVVCELDAAGTVRRSTGLKMAIAFWISALRSPDVNGSTSPAGAGIDDERNAIFGPERCRRACASPYSTSGSLSGGAIEPETSSRNTRLRGGRCAPRSSRRACWPISARRWARIPRGTRQLLWSLRMARWPFWILVDSGTGSS